MRNHKKQIVNVLSWLAVFGWVALASCGGGDGGGTDPQPSSVTLTTTTATFNGSPITPVPNYSLTLNFDASGRPNGYSVSGTATKQPTIGSSGTFAVSGSQVTFTSGGQSRQVTIAGGQVTATTVSLDLRWDLTKVDDGVSAAEQGTYLYRMTK